MFAVQEKLGVMYFPAKKRLMAALLTVWEGWIPSQFTWPPGLSQAVVKLYVFLPTVPISPHKTSLLKL